MNKMIERVARAIARARYARLSWALVDESEQKKTIEYEVDIYWEHFVGDARAAIKAMRYPTPEMYAYANEHEAKDKELNRRGSPSMGYAALIYEGMIDVARGGDGSWKDDSD